ncbi:cell division topological specificity factor MinE [Methylocystis sp. IM3]|jgi:cell division topological specificity factor|uniref:cell division topological specificity factor MinE n=1 Tax=unclassified Methylocystis TaxID=2625913 RepID=UPI000F93E364|nr:MAG: cell division topological specificity factor MinE [Hyphomicrobiales bacterium]
MNLFRIFNRGASAPIARERLQILLAHERSSSSKPDLLAVLHKEVLAAISKHVAVEPDKVEVKVHRKDEMSVLEIGIEIDGEAMTFPAAVTDDRAA